MNFNAFQLSVSKNAEQPAERWVYRGHGNPFWSLRTHYSRFFEELGLDSGVFNLERFRRMLRRLARSASESTGTNYDAHSLVQQMAIAQHHGIPTPLLDWSHSPYVAAYFAAALPPGGLDRIEICIHGLDVSQLPEGELSRNEQEVMLSEDGCFRFIDTNNFFSRRILRQMGCFTFQNFPGCLYDWSKSHLHIPLKLRRYEITGNRSQILRELALMGITGGTLFDDLEHLAKDIVDAERALAAQHLGKI